MSTYEKRINGFDQERINSFLTCRKAYHKPLMAKLPEATYKQYKGL